MEDSGIDSDPKINHVEDERLFLGSDSSCSSNHITIPHQKTAKQLQKKLEVRIEQAKRIQRNINYIKIPKYDNENKSTASTELISAHRLRVPHKNKENLPLVDWHSESDSETETIIFPSKVKDSSKHKQELTDTFSIEELSEESEDSLNLDPAMPRPSVQSYIPSNCFACHCHIL